MQILKLRSVKIYGIEGYLTIQYFKTLFYNHDPIGGSQQLYH